MNLDCESKFSKTVFVLLCHLNMDTLVQKVKAYNVGSEHSNFQGRRDGTRVICHKSIFEKSCN